MSLAAPVAEGAHDGLWLVAYAASCGGLDVMAYRYRRDGAAVDLGARVVVRSSSGAWSVCGTRTEIAAPRS